MSTAFSASRSVLCKARTTSCSEKPMLHNSRNRTESISRGFKSRSIPPAGSECGIGEGPWELSLALCPPGAPRRRRRCLCWAPVGTEPPSPDRCECAVFVAAQAPLLLLGSGGKFPTFRAACWDWGCGFEFPSRDRDSIPGLAEPPLLRCPCPSTVTDPVVVLPRKKREGAKLSMIPWMRCSSNSWLPSNGFADHLWSSLLGKAEPGFGGKIPTGGFSWSGFRFKPWPASSLDLLWELGMACCVPDPECPRCCGSSCLPRDAGPSGNPPDGTLDVFGMAPENLATGRLRWDTGSRLSMLLGQGETVTWLVGPCPWPPLTQECWIEPSGLDARIFPSR